MANIDVTMHEAIDVTVPGEPDLFGRSAERVIYPWKEPYFSFSGCNSRDKYTRDCICCVAYIAAGKTQQNAEDVSIMGHVALGVLEKQRVVRQHLQELLAQLRDGTDPTNRVVGLAGGCFDMDMNRDRLRSVYQQRYVDLIGLLANVSADVLKCDPVILTGPKLEMGGSTHVHYKTAERRAIIVQSPQRDKRAFPSVKAADLAAHAQVWTNSPPFISRLWEKLRRKDR